MRLIGLILILSTATTHAELLLDEHFFYNDGILQEVSAGKWTGHSGETNQVDVTDGGVNLTAKEAQDVNTLLLNAPYLGANGAVLYAAFKVNFSALPTKTGSYFAHFKSASATGFRGRVWAQLTADKKISIGITSATSSDPVLHPAPLELNTDHRVVIRLEVGTSLTSLWIDPSTEADASVQSDTGNPLAITSFALRQASGIGTLRIDDIVVATTFEELTGRQAGSPVIVRSPAGLTVTAGMPANFSVEAAGVDRLVYQWFFNNSEIM
ncbi:MAG: hypothetical protein JWM99_2412, partial [Verrucomicrobiales bacterium]|nr:hypothetical protein [Verrucomicrobiales bacterium]